MKFAYVVGFLFFTHIFSISDGGGGRKTSKGKEKKEVRNINVERSSRRREERKEVHNINAGESSSSLYEMQEPEEEDMGSLEQSEDVWDTAIAPNKGSNQQSDDAWVKAIDRAKKATKKLQCHEQMYRLYCAKNFSTQADVEYARKLPHCKGYFPQAHEELIRSMEQSVASIDQEFKKYKQQPDYIQECARLLENFDWGEQELRNFLVDKKAAEYGSSSKAAAANLPKLDASSTENEETREKNSDSEK